MSRGLPLKHLLEDFARAADSAPRAGDTGPALPGGGHPPRFQVERKITEAYERGISEGRASVQLEIEVVMAEQRVAWEFDLQRHRAEWVTREADVLTSQLIEGLASLELAIATPVQQLLVPMLRAELQQQVFRDLVAKILQLRGGLSSFSVEGHGATDLLEALRARLEPHGIIMSLHPQMGTDLTIKHDQTVIEANVAVWWQRVTEALS
jgi:hypothetical protein